MRKSAQSSFGGSEENPVSPENLLTDVAPGLEGIGGVHNSTPQSNVLDKSNKIDERLNVALKKKHQALTAKVASIIDIELALKNGQGVQLSDKQEMDKEALDLKGIVNKVRNLKLRKKDAALMALRRVKAEQQLKRKSVNKLT
jgi:hypothetical protein